MTTNRRIYFSVADSDSLSDACAVCPTSRHCCYRVATIVVSEAERQGNVRKHGHADLFINQGGGLHTIQKEPGKPCPFLTEHEACGIYSERPHDCRSWPITHQSPPRLAHFSADSLCPEIERGLLPSEFLDSANKSLNEIPFGVVAHFAELVHRDETVLPLIPIDLSFAREKK